MSNPENHTTTPESAARFVTERLQQNGHVATFAGGCVRDRLLAKQPTDFDIATDALPERVVELFPRALEVGKAFGVIIVQHDGHNIEVATFRLEGGYEDGRHPEHVSFSTNIEDDAHRRDFTINAMFYDPVADKVLDFVHGRDDLEKRIIRCVGKAEERFGDDHLRMLRAVRFASRFEFTLDAETHEAIQTHAAQIQRISPERIREELTRTFMQAQRAGDALTLLDDVGLLAHVLPEVAALKGTEQPPQYHPEGDVFKHVVLMLNTMDERTPELIYAVLFHDIGKPATAEFSDGRIRFNGHAELGETMAQTIMRRLRFSNQMIDDVAACVLRHMRFIDVQKMRKAKLRRMIGAPVFPTELELHRLDCLSSHGMLDNFDFLTTYRADMLAEPVLPKPWITGRDILGLDVKEGPDVGKWHRLAYDQQLDGVITSREALLSWLADAIATERA